MKKVCVWFLAILLILQCCISGCAQSDNDKDGAAGEVSTITTAAQTTLTATMSNTTSASHTTSTQSTVVKSATVRTTGGIICTGVPPVFESFKSVEELFDCIRNSDSHIARLFRQAIRHLKSDRLLIIEAADDVFTLDSIAAIERSVTEAQVSYRFINKKGERVYLDVNLKDMNAPADHLERFVESSNRMGQLCYENYPVLHAGKEVVIWGESRQTYQRDYGQAISKETGETTPIYARFVTDIDGFVVECSLGGNLSRNNWDNTYLNHFKFSYKDITIPTANAAAITTTTQTMVDTTVPNATSANHTRTTQTTIRKTSGGSVAHKKFKSVEELFDWIHNGEDAPAALFTGAIQGLKLDHLLIIEAADDTFTLEYVRTFQRGSGWDAQIEYYFISEKGERVWLYVHLKDMHAPVDDIKKYVKSNNLDNTYLNHFKFSYKDITMPTSLATTTTVALS